MTGVEGPGRGAGGFGCVVCGGGGYREVLRHTGLLGLVTKLCFKL